MDRVTVPLIVVVDVARNAEAEMRTEVAPEIVNCPSNEQPVIVSTDVDPVSRVVVPETLQDPIRRRRAWLPVILRFPPTLFPLNLMSPTTVVKVELLVTELFEKFKSTAVVVLVTSNAPFDVFPSTTDKMDSSVERKVKRALQRCFLHNTRTVLCDEGLSASSAGPVEAVTLYATPDSVDDRVTSNSSR